MRSTETASAWLSSLRVFVGAAAIGNLAWETVQLPLYTIWNTGSLREQAFAVIHCTLGDILIALSSLTLALIVIGDRTWPHRRFWRVALLAIVLGAAYTVYSEWLNVSVRAAWAYSDRMPLISLFGLKTGLSPLLQWVIVPAATFKIAARHLRRRVSP